MPIKSEKSPRAKTTRPAAKEAIEVEPNIDRAIALVMEMMAIPGKSGEEQAIADYIVAKLKAAGLGDDAIRFDTAHKRSPLGGTLGNLIVKIPGTASGQRRMLSAHLDTVPICVGCRPTRKGDLVHSADANTGLGGDNRAGAAVLLVAALEILSRDLPRPPVTLAWFVQEEVGLQGSHYLQTSLLGKPKLAFNFDGGSPEKLTLGATGGYRMEIDIRGLASHAGGAPEQGISAIAIASLAIADLHHDSWHGLIQKTDARGRALQGTSNVGVIRGGDATNVVTDRVVVRAEARSHDSKFRSQIIKRIETAFRDAARIVTNADGKCGSVEISGRLDYESFRLTAKEPCVTAAEGAVRKAGGEPIHAISNGGLDANWLTTHGIPTVTLGCGQKNIHTTAEQLDLKEFAQACRIGLHLATATE
jgi:tripeptide aminopeptidase